MPPPVDDTKKEPTYVFDVNEKDEIPEDEIEVFYEEFFDVGNYDI